MADRVGTRVEGLSRVVRQVRALGLEVEDLKDAFAKIAAEGARRAAAHAPKRSGRLAADIRGNRATSKAVVTAGRASLKYAGPINYGWPKRNILASEFLQKADQEMEPRALQILEDEINQAIRQRGLQ
jgi:hypothetical protein